MLRRSLLLLAVCSTAVAMLCSPAAADEFNSLTQSHFGACARETESVPQAVHDYLANGVADQFARLVGISSARHPLARQLRMQLVVGSVVQQTVTANHGCDGLGLWYPVGARTLYAGERVGAALGERLRRRICIHRDGHCKRIVVSKHVVFPTNCWNPNTGTVAVAIYVHKVRRHHHHRHKKPKRHHHVTPTPPPTPPPPAPAPTPTPTPTPPPVVTTPEPSASAALNCAAAAVQVTISNASTATADASFTVNEKSYGPLAPGNSETIELPLKPGEELTLTVTSGSKKLIEGEVFSNTCKAEPAAQIAGQPRCEVIGNEFGARLEIELSNGAAATLSAPFTIEWTGFEEKLESKEFGPLKPGESETVVIIVGPKSENQQESFGEFTVTSEGNTVLEEHEVGFPC